MTATVRLLGSAAVRIAVVLGFALALAPSGAEARLSVGKGGTCEPVEDGQPIRCQPQAGWDQNAVPPLEAVFIRVDSAVDTVEGCDQPENLSDSIIGVLGNASCTQSGSPGTACDPANPSSCTLPCVVCEANAVVGGGDDPQSQGLPCPGPAKADGNVDGTIQFQTGETANACLGSCPETEELIGDSTRFIGENATQTSQFDVAATAFSICTPDVEPPTLTKQCPDPEDPTQVRVDFTNVPALDCVVEDEIFTGLSVCPATLPERGTGTPLGSASASGTGSVNFPLGGLTGCNVARLVCDGEVVLQATDACGGENFKCYTAKFDPRGPRFSSQEVVLQDQFRTAEARVIRPYELCTPVDKNLDGIINESAHLMCYKIIDGGPRGRETVSVTDQFGTERMITANARTLCVPAIKNCDPEAEDQSCEEQLRELQAALNHFQCYAARTAPGTAPVIDPEEPLSVRLTDQFETERSTDISRSVYVCNPTAKFADDTTTPIVNESGHLKCYDAEDAADQAPFTGRTVSVDDQFGSWQVRVGNVSHLCEDAAKEDLSSVRRAPR